MAPHTITHCINASLVWY